MSIDTLDHEFVPSIPEDPLDPPRFGGVKQTTKDVFKAELTKYFARSGLTSNQRSEIPLIEKYDSMGSNDPYESVLRVVRKYPDILQHLPHVCVLATSLDQRPFSVGPPLIAAVQASPQIVAVNPGPYSLNDGDQLVFITTPPGQLHALETSTFVFRTADIPQGSTSTLSSLSAADMAAMINVQALFITASVLSVVVSPSLTQTYLVLATGGVMGQGTPNTITVLSASSASVLSTLGIGRSGTATSITGSRPNMQLVAPAATFRSTDVGLDIIISGTTTPQFNDGTFHVTAVSLDGTTLNYTNPYGIAEAWPVGATWFLGLKDDSFNPARPPFNRYGYMFDVGVQIQVLTDDDQTRDQVSDLVSSYLTFFMERQFFTYLGRSVFDPTVVGENYEIVMKSDLRSSSEDEIPVGNSQFDKINADVFNFTCHVIQCIDRTVVQPYGPNAGQGWTIDGKNGSFDETLPRQS